MAAGVAWSTFVSLDRYRENPKLVNPRPSEYGKGMKHSKFRPPQNHYLGSGMSKRSMT